MNNELGEQIPPDSYDSDTSNNNKMGGISVEEGKRRDDELLKQLAQDARNKRAGGFLKSMILWFIFYNIIGLLILNYFEPRSLDSKLYHMGIAVCATGAAIIYATTITGISKVAVPGAMVVADSNLGVMKDMQAAKNRVYRGLSGPLQGFVYGILLIILSYSV
ncbi:MAG: hypothetical protein ACW99A_09620 [Candidatus Kariarchaeaceae archaeon]|jgi:hypothetical protein